MDRLIVLTFCGLWTAVSCIPLPADSPLTQPREDLTLGGPGSQQPVPKVHLQMLPTGQLPQHKPTAPNHTESGTRTDPIQTLPPTHAVFPQTGPLPPVIPQHGFLIPQPGGQPLFMVMYPNTAGVQPQFHPLHFPQYHPYGPMMVPGVFPTLPLHPAQATLASQPGQPRPPQQQQVGHHQQPQWYQLHHPHHPHHPQQQQQQQQQQIPQVHQFFGTSPLVAASGGFSSEELRAKMGVSVVNPLPAASPAAQPLSPVMPVGPVVPLDPLLPFGPGSPIMVSDPRLPPVEVPIEGSVPTHDIMFAGLGSPQAPAETVGERLPVTNHQTTPPSVLSPDPPATAAAGLPDTMGTEVDALIL